MSKKTYRITIGIVAAVTTAFASIASLFDASWITPAVAIAGIVNGAVAEICSLFVKDE